MTQKHCSGLAKQIKLILFILIAPVASLNAQVQLDTAKKAVKKILVNFPSTRFLDVQYEQFTPGDYHSKLYERPFEKGNVKSQSRFKAAANVPLVKKERWALRLALRYKMEMFEFREVHNEPVSEGPPIYHDTKESFHFFSTGLTYIYYSVLFGKTAVYNASVVAEGSEGGFERINGTFTTSLLLKKNANTTLGVGLLLQSNNTAIFPILPVFTYEHNFKNSAWSMDIVLPRYAYLRRGLTEKSRISFGTSFDGESFYVYPSQPGLAKTYQFNRNEFKTGFVYEHLISTGIILSLRGGLNATLPSSFRVLNATDKVMSSTQDPNGYFNIGVSYIPGFRK